MKLQLSGREIYRYQFYIRYTATSIMSGRGIGFVGVHTNALSRKISINVKSNQFNHTFSLLECANVTTELVDGFDVFILLDTIKDNTATSL